MNNKELKTSEEWYPIIYPNKEVIIMDPDGWDRKNWKTSWSTELITELEFKIRVGRSTCIFTKDFFTTKEE